MGGPDRVPLLLIGCVLGLALLAAAASAATTEVHVVKVASDGSTVIAERTVDYRWLEANLPVKGDGSTHYYHQGPVLEGDRWDPSESINVEDKDMGAVKGTALRDLCGLVGGMSSGDTLVVKASDGDSKPFSYGTVYSPSSRQGQVVLTWYRADDGYVPSYWSGMRIVFFADTSVNPWGWHVFGNSDMKASLPESAWHYYNRIYPTTTGLSIQSVNDLRIFSTQAAPTKPTTTVATTAKTTVTTSAATTTGTSVATTTATTVPEVSVLPTASMAPDGTTTIVTTATTYDGVDPIVVNTTGVATATATVTVTTAANSTATVNTTDVAPSATQPPVATGTVHGGPTENSVPTWLDVTTDIDQGGTVTPTPTVTANATGTNRTVNVSMTTVPTTQSPPRTLVPSSTLTVSPGDQAGPRSLTFTFSFEIQEGGNGPVVNASTGGSAGPSAELVWAFLKAVGRLIDLFL